MHLVKSEPSKNGPSKVSLSDCNDLPFVVLTKKQQLRQLFDSLCTSEGISPDDITEVVSITTAWSMVSAGVGATILPLKFAEDERFHAGITFFELKNVTTTRQPVVVTKKGQHISKYTKYAIELLTGK